MRARGKRSGALRVVFSLTLLILAPVAVAAEQLVSGRYLGASGRDIRLELQVGSPPPATVIVTQYLPADVVIDQASPAANRFDEKRGEAKWLLNGISGDRLNIDMRLSRPVKAGELRGQIQYKHPVTGSMVVEEIRQ
jgi:hypothetical protein